MKTAAINSRMVATHWEDEGNYLELAGLDDTGKGFYLRLSRDEWEKLIALTSGEEEVKDV